MKKIYDVSKCIDETMVVYKNKPEKQINRRILADYNTADYYESNIDINMHTGTHIDAPLHMLKDGASIESYNLNLFVGPCTLYDLTHVKGAIYKDDLLKLNIQKGCRVLFKTSNSYDKVYNPKFVYIEEDAATYLVDCGVITIGIDAMSVERDKKEHPTHKIILKAGIGIIEDMALKEVPPGDYQLIALPLKLNRAEASPIRAILIKDSENYVKF